MEEARPHREQAKALEERLRDLCKGNQASPAECAKAEAIDAAVFDLKAVNLNRTSDEDTRRPGELIADDRSEGEDGDTALSRLQELSSAP